MMSTSTRTAAPRELGPDAVVWIDEGHAIVARTDDGGIATTEIRRVGRNETRYLADVVHEIGSRDPVMIVGPQPIRLALERAYVGISHRPDRLIATPLGTASADADVRDRLERLAA